jgi:hypothetical protein
MLPFLIVFIMNTMKRETNNIGEENIMIRCKRDCAGNTIEADYVETTLDKKRRQLEVRSAQVSQELKDSGLGPRTKYNQFASWIGKK